ncbi:hypothetical protein I603_2763 [Erythrobacter dokdonensis DSW-74]|uniref:Uncharacterized protein n=1 Tax=Erythrobacter dokdonensis DSW-74 TaxID=1300349 RepID=A0A1A7BEQ7_9SPHN|nr:hypothetical protein I603_2763 [Erythrobacter dokdonensis DSW-74]
MILPSQMQGPHFKHFDKISPLSTAHEKNIGAFRPCAGPAGTGIRA